MALNEAARSLLREGLRHAGFTLRRYSVSTVPDAQIQALLVHHRIDLVIDVGANTGQYAQSLRRAGYRGRILSFEPLKDAWEQCAARAAGDPMWTLAPRCALGAADAVAEIHVARNSVSSSLLPMHDIHRAAAPESSYVGSESVEVRRLDHVAAEAVSSCMRPFLKVDTQGYEREVLEGASGIVSGLTGIQLEMSLTPLYEGSPTISDLLQLMERWQFKPYALLPAFTDPESGRMLQVDGLFFREPSTASR